MDSARRARGERFVGDVKSIQVGGKLPVNTHGGWMSGSMGGQSHSTLIELVRQLQGTTGDRQVPNAKLGFWGAIGGVASVHSVAILGTD